MERTCVVDGDCMVLRLTEDLDHHLTEKIRDSIDRMIVERRIRNIVIDFTGTGFMDSSGIGFIMGRYKRIAPWSGTIYVVGLGPALERIFKISGLFSITVRESSVEKAIRKAKGGQPA